MSLASTQAPAGGLVGPIEAPQDVEVLYDELDSTVGGDCGPLRGCVAELRAAVELAPGARGALKVRRIYRARCGELQGIWESRKRQLGHRAAEGVLPKPSWPDAADAGGDEVRTAVEARDREEVLWQLLSCARWELDGVWSARVFHGATNEKVARSICSSGFAGNVQATKGWFGEGIYVSTMAAYALRYALDMTDFWEASGRTGFLVAGRAAFSNVYPVTQADNSEGALVPGLKGKPIGGRAAPGAKGCDAHFACVQGVPPHGSELRRTYHACRRGKRPDGTELVVSQESQILPEYILEVRVTTDASLLAQIGLAAASWPGHSPAWDCPDSTPAAAPDGGPVGTSTHGTGVAPGGQANASSEPRPQPTSALSGGQASASLEPPPQPTSEPGAGRQPGSPDRRSGASGSASSAGQARQQAEGGLPSEEAVLAVLRQASGWLPVRDVYFQAKGIDSKQAMMDSAMKSEMNRLLKGLQAAGKVQSADGKWRIA